MAIGATQSSGSPPPFSLFPLLAISDPRAVSTTSPAFCGAAAPADWLTLVSNLRATRTVPAIPAQPTVSNVQSSQKQRRRLREFAANLPYIANSCTGGSDLSPSRFATTVAAPGLQPPSEPGPQNLEQN